MTWLKIDDDQGMLWVDDDDAHAMHMINATITLGCYTRPPMVANHGESRVLCSTAFEDQGEPFNQGRFDPTAQIHLRGLYKQGPWPLEK